jgi:hypothetical protein
LTGSFDAVEDAMTLTGEEKELILAEFEGG